MKRVLVFGSVALAASAVLAEAGSTFGVGHVPVKLKDDRPSMSVSVDAWATNAESKALFDRVCNEYRQRGDTLSMAAFAARAMSVASPTGKVYEAAFVRRYAAALTLRDEPAVAQLQREIAARPFDAKTRSLLNATAEQMPAAGVERIEAVYAPVRGKGDAAFVGEIHRRCFLNAATVRDYPGMAAHFEAGRGKHGTGTDRSCSARYLGRLVQSLAWGMAEPIAAEAHANWPDDADFARWLAVSRLGLGNREGAVAALAKAVAATNQPPEKAFVLQAIDRVARAAKPEDVKKSLVALRATCKDDREYVTRMHVALETLLGPLMTDTGRPYLKAAREALETCVHEEERVVATVTYRASAPATAEGAELSGLFDLPTVERRFGKYGVYANCRGNSDFTKLRDQPKPDLVAMKGEGREGALIAVYDESGVHFYARFRHPDAAKFKLGEAGGAYAEFSFMPGVETGYHQVFLQSGVDEELNQIEWDSIAPGRRRTLGNVHTDQAVRDDCFLFHVYVPWTFVYTRLPKDGDSWLTVMLADTPDGSFTLGGGIGHEFGRGARFVFEMPEARAKAVRRALLRRAARDYLAYRNKLENAEIWADRDMGDPAFFEQSVKAWLIGLDEAAKAIGEAKDLHDAAVEARFGKYLADWADFHLALDARRAAWIEEGLFKED